MARCPTIARSGQPCKGLVRAGSEYCPAHDPSRKEQRRAAASKAGKVKAALSTPAELREVKARLKELADEVLSGKAARADASVAAQVLGVYLKAVSVELKAREQAELVERLEELEDVLNRKDASGWR